MQSPSGPNAPAAASVPLCRKLLRAVPPLIRTLTPRPRTVTTRRLEMTSSSTLTRRELYW